MQGLTIAQWGKITQGTHQINKEYGKLRRSEGQTGE